MFLFLPTLIGVIAVATAVQISPNGTGLGDWATAYELANKALGRLSIDTKTSIVTGISRYAPGYCVGKTGNASSIGFSMCLQDSPLGIRYAKGNSTAFTPGYMAGATWDIELIRERGRFLGAEAKSVGIHAQLGPMAGALGKIPEAGRNWEGFSVDPYLQGIAVALTVEGMQKSGVQTVTKHLIGNEQEQDRLAMSANIDDRVLHELYLWPFADAVHSNTAGIMCSYNRVNGSWACENEQLLGGLLKTELGFQGYVVSDWGAHHTTNQAALAGLDLGMPNDGNGGSDGLWGSTLATAVQKGDVPLYRLDDMVRRILASWYLLNQNIDYPSLNIGGLNVTGSHRTNVRAVARDGIVLLRNEGNVLPLSKPKSVAVIGSAALQNSKGINSCQDRGCNTGALGMGWGSGTAEYPYFVAPYDALKTRTDMDGTQINLSGTDDPTQGADVANGKDAAIVIITADSGEGFLNVENNAGDRLDLNPWHNGNELVKAVAAKNSNTIVVIHSVGPVILETVLNTPGVRAVVWAGLPSSESGNALVDILYGETSPSGKLPYTIAKKESDYPAKIVSGDDNFTEGLYIDYRYFDTKNIEPRFPFGFGLSYATFSFNNININSSATPGPALGPVLPGGRADLWEEVATVTCTVKNDGVIKAAEVAQLYIGLPTSAPQAPPRQLRGFVKLQLGPGESGLATFKLRRRDLSYWDTGSQEWILANGTFNVYIGASSRDIRLNGTISTTLARDAYSTIQAETYDDHNGTWKEHTSDTGGGDNVGWIHKGNWLGYRHVDFGSQGARRFSARIASGAGSDISGIVQVSLGSPDATPICEIRVSNTGGWQNWTTVSAELNSVRGTHPVYLAFTGNGDSDFVNVNWFKFFE